jgi:hypothetical protein
VPLVTGNDEGVADVSQSVDADTTRPAADADTVMPPSGSIVATGKSEESFFFQILLNFSLIMSFVAGAKYRIVL